ncbi:DegT/DnrJ/EryC1/StrS family aminotransferase [Pseudonocardia benzenivorans]|uniref:DegT/DnrJ/EryC1/StrS family aminotransferase n=1 Tax=Pseudonocardia benzenivorans TaxID=228005 RepID=A0ABW3VGU3_9PSEU
MTASPTRLPTIPVMRPLLGEEEAEAVAEVVRSGWVAQGPKVAEFEREFAASVGAGHGIATTSCTTALHLSLLLLGIGPGDEVVVPSFSFIATANTVRHCGGTPVFADVERDSGNLDPASVAAVITPRTRAVVVVHQGGMPCDVSAIAAVCGDLPIVEDAACAAGSQAHGRPVGSGALLAAWSFHPRKVLTTGEGGMITTDDPEWAVRLRRLREHGMSVSAADRHAAGDKVIIESYVEQAYNFRLTDLQAAMGLVQLRRLPGMVDRRRELAARYASLLHDLGVRPVADPPFGRSNFQSYWVELPDSAPPVPDVLQTMARAGVSGRRGIMAAHLEPAYAGHPHVPLPVTEHLTTRSLILPLYHDMTESDQRRVVDTLAAAITDPSGAS